MARPDLFISHDRASVRRFAERVVMLDAGKVVAAGLAGEVLKG